MPYWKSGVISSIDDDMQRYIVRNTNITYVTAQIYVSLLNT